MPSSLLSMPELTAKQKQYQKDIQKLVRTPSKGVEVGHLYNYEYQAKVAEYWDALPLTLVIAKKSDGWLGLSLHYLPKNIRDYFVRKILIKNLPRLKRGKPVDVTYEAIKLGDVFYKEGIAIIRRYLASHVRSRIVDIPWKEWLNALSLESAQWMNTTAALMYAQSKQIVSGLGKPKLNKTSSNILKKRVNSLKPRGRKK